MGHVEGHGEFTHGLSWEGLSPYWMFETVLSGLGYGSGGTEGEDGEFQGAQTGFAIPDKELGIGQDLFPT